MMIIGVTALGLITGGALAGYAFAHGEVIEDGHSAVGETGEGGENGEAGDEGVDLTLDDGGFLVLLATTRGHIEVARAVYLAGDRKAAAHHAAHPGHEIMPQLNPILQRRGLKAPDLSSLELAISQDRDVAQAYENVIADIMAAIGALAPSDAMKAQAIVKLARYAADEYREGVKDGKIVNSDEYQDAFGFILSAEELAKAITGDTNKTHAGKMTELLQAMKAAWVKGGLLGKSTDVTVGAFSSQASAIEIEAQKIR